MTLPAELADEYPTWWVDLLGEHNHVGGIEATRWLLARANIRPGDRVLDCGAFVGGTARLAAKRGAAAVALDSVADFLAAGRRMEGGADVTWVCGTAQRLPFADASFASLWSLDSPIVPRELTRVAAPGARLCLCAEAPADSRGGLDSFFDEWAELGWSLAAHRPYGLEALQTWRFVEAELVARRPYFERRYGSRPYLAQLDLMAYLVKAYERGEMSHGLFVFERG